MANFPFMKPLNLLKSKLPQTGTNIFTVMSSLAHEHGAINLSQGFPDFSCDHRLLEAVENAMRNGHNQYAPMPGINSLRAQISLLVERLYGAKYDAFSEITITSGATEALLCAIFAVVHPGDEVIVIEPAYDSYLPAIQLSGGIPVCIPLQFPDYKPDWNQIKDTINPKTRAIILNTPHNPTGSILETKDLQQLAEIVKNKSLFIISDEVYEHIIFDGEAHQSICRYPELIDRSFVISSFGKSLHTTGWKVGYCLAPTGLSVEFRKVHQYTTFATSHPFQQGIASYMEQYPEEILGLGKFYQRKRDLFLELMKESRFEPLPCKGTYFQLMKYGKISDQSDFDFSQWLTTKHGVACIPVSVFYKEKADFGVVRFCFAKEDGTLEKAAEKLVEV